MKLFLCFGSPYYRLKVSPVKHEELCCLILLEKVLKVLTRVDELNVEGIRR